VSQRATGVGERAPRSCFHAGKAFPDRDQKD
jgi:hypothetical protein